MSKAKKLGIWMDHSNAHLIIFDSGEVDKKMIASSFSSHDNESPGKNENLMHNKEQHHQATFYKKLGQEIRKFDEVLLFGPTNAKAELLNTFKGDQHFDSIKIHTEQTDKLTENQQHAFVRSYFSTTKL